MSILHAKAFPRTEKQLEGTEDTWKDKVRCYQIIRKLGQVVVDVMSWAGRAAWTTAGESDDQVLRMRQFEGFFGMKRRKGGEKWEQELRRQEIPLHLQWARFKFLVLPT